MLADFLGCYLYFGYVQKKMMMWPKVLENLQQYEGSRGLEATVEGSPFRAELSAVPEEFYVTNGRMGTTSF